MTDECAGTSTLALLCAVNFVVIMDAQIVILALPSIQTGLDFGGQGSAQWVLSAYLLCFGGLLLLGGRAGDLFGRRRMFLLGTAVFGLASLGCGVAPSPAVLIAARAVQGVSAALMAPTALAILAATFSEERDRNRALTLWGAVGGVGATGALLIGGGLTSSVGWRWIFFINVPVAAVVLALAPRLFTESRSGDERTSVDVLGAFTLTIGLFAAIFALVEAPSAGWGSVRTLSLFAAAVVLLAAFVVTERRVGSPLVPPSLLRSRLLVGGNGAVFAAGMCAWGIGLITSDYAQQVLGYSPIGFGLASLALTVGAMAGAVIGQRLLPRLGGYLLTVMAVLLTAGCVLLTTLSSNGSYFGDLFAGLTLFGVGLGAITVVGSVAALRDVDADDHGVASGINTAAFQVGGAVGSAIAASVLAGTAAGRVVGLNHAAEVTVVLGVVAIGFALLVSGRPARTLRTTP